jgi:hypothetical protein
MSEQIIQLLIAEKNRLERVIQILQGSSPKVVENAADPLPAPTTAPAPKRKGFSAATRRKMAEGQKRRWAAINAAKVEAAAPKISKKLAAIVAPPEDAEFKSKMSIAMAKSWAKRRAAAKKRTVKAGVR